MNSMIELMYERHSVRQYKSEPVKTEIVQALKNAVDECNNVSGLNIQLVTDEPKAFDGFMAHYGKFSGVKNYIAMIGPKGSDEKVGYYGEKLVLLAQSLGLNTCWVALTFNKKKASVEVGPGQKFFIAIPFGYGENNGTAHKSKSIADLCQVSGDMPEWFKNGIEATMLAPTALNQQKFTFILDEDRVTAKTKPGACTRIDLGIAKYHFEIGSGKEGLFEL